MASYEMNDETLALMERYKAASQEQAELVASMSELMKLRSISMSDVAHALEASRKKVEGIFAELQKHRIA